MATAGKMNTTLMGVYAATTKIAHANDASVSLSMDARSVTTKDSGGYAEYLEGLRSGTITCGALYADDATYGVNDLMTIYTARSAVTVLFSTEVTGDDHWSASCYITALEINSGGQEDTVSYTATFQITGVITFASVT